ncbi:MAG: hypothetical protein M9887_10825 [Chitinophagales bacterium]|nr:hypothetical protein [Chitinophagales bacterium]
MCKKYIIEINYKFKISVSVFLLLLSLNSCSSIDKDIVRRKSDREILKLKGLVKSFSETKYYAGENGSAMKGERTSIFSDFREALKVTENGMLVGYAYEVWKQIHEFNIEGDLVLKMDLDKRDSIHRKLIHSYTPNNDEKNTAFFDEAVGVELKTKNTYNNQGYLEEAIQIYPDGNIYNKTSYYYDSENNLIKWVSDNPEIKIKCKIEYDTIRKERTEYREATSKGKYVSGSNNTNIRIDVFDDNENRIRQIFNFETDGEVVKVRIETKYDKNGNEIESTRYTLKKGIETKSLSQYYYDFDIKGNWINKYYSFNGELVDITERKFEYFK